MSQNLISITEYAKLVNRDTSSIRQKILRGNLPAVKIGGVWLIDRNTPYQDGRRTRNNAKPAKTDEQR